MEGEKMPDRSPNFRLLSYTWPLFIESLLRMLIGNVNVFMLSRYSDQAVAAVGVANQILGMFLILYSIVGTGTAIIICQHLGAGEKDTARKVAHTAIVMNTILGVILSILISAFAKQLLKAMNLPDELMGYAAGYTVIVGAVSFTNAIIATMAGIARSYGYIKLPMYVALGMNILNAAGNYAAIFKPFGLPQYGVTGVAVSVVISNLAGVAVMSYILYSKLGIRLRLKELFSFPRAMGIDIFKMGGPAAGEYISYTFSQMAITYIVAGLGAGAIATRVYVQNLTAFISILSMALGQGSQILIGHLVGAGNMNDANKLCRRSLKLALISNFSLTLGLILIRKQLFGIFTKDTAIIDLGSIILVIDLGIELGRAFNHVVGNSLRGAGDVRYPVTVGILSMWGIGTVLCQILGISLHLGLAGIWLALTLDEWSRGLILLKRWKSQKWQQRLVAGPSCKEAGALKEAARGPA